MNQSSYQIIEALWKQCLPLVQSEVANLITDNTMTIAQIEEAKLLASERVRWLVPPNEVNGQVASAQAIINSGWFAKLLYKDEIFSLINRTEMPESEYELMNLINGLLKYALHAAQIHERWQR